MVRDAAVDTGATTVELAQGGRYEPPDGWVWTTLRNVGTVNMGQSPRGIFTNALGEGLPLIGGASDIEVSGPKPARYTSQPTRVCRSGDIIVCVRATIGKTVKADREYCLGRGVASIKPASSSGDFMRWYLASQVEQLKDLGTGTTFKQISKDDLNAFPIPLAPLAEQQRIVAKVEALFEQSRTARAALDRIPPLLRKFRQSVLAAAFSGDLTSDWREQRPDVEPAPDLLGRIRAERRRYEERDRPHSKVEGRRTLRSLKYRPLREAVNDLPLPQNWAWVQLEELTRIQNGRAFPSKEYCKEGTRLLRPGNLHTSAVRSCGTKRTRSVFRRNGLKIIRTSC